MLKDAFVDCPIAKKEFEIELSILSSVRHPNIVTLLGAGTKPVPFLVLEKLQDISYIFNIQPNNRPTLLPVSPSATKMAVFSFDKIIRMVSELAAALQYLHEEFDPSSLIIHRYLSISTRLALKVIIQFD
jgi:serine/threonine protein kinase